MIEEKEISSNVGYRRLVVWKEAHELVLMIYKTTKTFPREELFGLISQIRRAAVSVAANIVEGQARSSRKEFIQFLHIANGSLVEVEYYLKLAKDLGYVSDDDYISLDAKRRYVGILLHKFITSLTR